MNTDNGPFKCAIWTGRKAQASLGPRVLVVDDYVDTADAITMILSINGFTAEAAYGGFTAIDATQSWRPQIVLLDIWMPDMSGLDVAEHIRANADMSPTILIAHSAAAGEPDLQRAKRAGFDAFCAKPTDAPVLVPLLRHFAPMDAPDA